MFPRFMERSFSVFDFHVHLYPDALASKAVGQLARRFGNPPAFDGTVVGMKANLNESGIRCALNLPVATRPDQVDSINVWTAANNDGPVYSLATVHPDTPHLPDVLAGIRAAGFKGIKLHPEYQLFTLDDPRLTPVWELCPDLGLFVFLHAGGERVFEPPYHTSPSALAALIDRYPRLTVVAAHLGGFKMWDESEAVLIGKKIYLDLSHTLFWTSDDQIIRMVKKHGPAKILFGTDAPWQTPAAVLDAFLRLPFTETEQRQILWENAVRLLGLRDEAPHDTAPRTTP